MTIADTAMSSQVVPGIAQAEGMIPSMGPMIGMIAPDVTDVVVTLANNTIALIVPVLTTFGTSLHSEIQVVTDIAKTNAHCTFGSGSTRSGPGALLLAAALAAWDTGLDEPRRGCHHHYRH